MCPVRVPDALECAETPALWNAVLSFWPQLDVCRGPREDEPVEKQIQRMFFLVRRPDKIGVPLRGYRPAMCPTTPQALNKFLARSAFQRKWFQKFDELFWGKYDPAEKPLLDWLIHQGRLHGPQPQHVGARAHAASYVGGGAAAGRGAGRGRKPRSGGVPQAAGSRSATSRSRSWRSRRRCAASSSSSSAARGARTPTA